MHLRSWVSNFVTVLQASLLNAAKELTCTVTSPSTCECGSNQPGSLPHLTTENTHVWNMICLTCILNLSGAKLFNEPIKFYGHKKNMSVHCLIDTFCWKLLKVLYWTYQPLKWQWFGGMLCISSTLVLTCGSVGPSCGRFCHPMISCGEVQTWRTLIDFFWLMMISEVGAGGTALRT